MESFIAELLLRHLACELLPTARGITRATYNWRALRLNKSETCRGVGYVALRHLALQWLAATWQAVPKQTPRVPNHARNESTSN